MGNGIFIWAGIFQLILPLKTFWLPFVSLATANGNGENFGTIF
jgi:hypothetical protein